MRPVAFVTGFLSGCVMTTHTNCVSEVPGLGLLFCESSVTVVLAPGEPRTCDSGSVMTAIVPACEPPATTKF
jgi:hypothetical protein